MGTSALIRACLVVGVYAGFSTDSHALDLPTPANRAVAFAADIQPLFKDRCYACHGADKQKGGLRLDIKAAAFAGGEDYEQVIIPGKSAESPLIKLVGGLVPDKRMPAKGEPLTADQIGLLRAWIDQGAQWPDDGIAWRDPKKSHWSFQPIRRPPMPVISEQYSASSHGSRNPIDAFILARLAEKHLTPSPEADRRTLIRRLYFTVIGLPPTPEEVHAFEQDTHPQAYERLVDRLLDSPHYGEKWASHWLDVVRFADSAGFETNHERPNAWPYRDYVIAAFNDDKPYDRFMYEQIAGDTVGEDAATGFIVGGAYDRVKGQDKLLNLQQRMDELADMVNTTGTAFLGMTIGCAKCHNHKFDPIPQRDFYAMQSIFSGVMHDERPMRPHDYAGRERKAAKLREELKEVQSELARFEPKAGKLRSVVVDDVPAAVNGESDPTGQDVIPPTGKLVRYDDGTGKGQFSDPGDARHIPNFTDSYHYWTGAPGTDFFTWHPSVNGRFRIWASWGAWTTHAADARYVLDLDGDLATKGDQREMANISQRFFADGEAAVPNERRWSGFKQLGTYGLTPRSRVILRGGDQQGPTVADVMLFEEVGPADSANTQAVIPHLRAPVSHRANTELFDPVTAKFVRFTITECSTIEPCIDELEIFTDGPNTANVALATAGTKATSSGNYGNGSNPKHKLEHINDGRYGNSFSWISNEKGRGWVQLEFANPEQISRVVWSRDRGDGREHVYDDRLAIGYHIEVSMDAKQWQKVASSEDRLPDVYRNRVPAIPALANVPPEEAAKVAGLVSRQDKLAGEIASLTVVPMVYAGKFTQPEPTHRLNRGDPLTPEEIVAPDALSVFSRTLGHFDLPPDAPEQQRRVAFAKWLTDPRNPLPARVLVNRLWHYTFGRGIVATPSDFGAMGFKPTHPELLDWLASEFIASEWSVKHIERLLLTSATFRQSSQPRPEGMKVDAGTTMLWRYPTHRLEGESIRDSILSVAGTLDLRMGGPGFLLFEPNANYSRNWVPQTKFDRSDFRRMVYVMKLRMEQDAIFGAFDIPDAGQVCPNRPRSTTPIQALNLYNSEFLLEQAGLFAQRVESKLDESPSAKITGAFELAYNRKPAAEELKAAQSLVNKHGLPALCRALLNSNEFLFVP